MRPRRALLIFGKVPRSGRVKTRLLPAVTPEQAAKIHDACISDTLRLARSAGRCDVVVFSSGGVASFRKRLKKREFVFPQSGEDLGERLERAFRKVFRMGYVEVVVIGTDTPWMGAQSVRRAFSSLAKSDLVIGPTVDGGYFLLGLRAFVPDVFRGIPWSTKTVCELTLRAAKNAGLRTKRLAKDFDLDRPEDLLRARKLLKNHPGRAPALAKVLAMLNAAVGKPLPT